MELLPTKVDATAQMLVYILEQLFILAGSQKTVEGLTQGLIYLVDLGIQVLDLARGCEAPGEVLL